MDLRQLVWTCFVLMFYIKFFFNGLFNVFTVKSVRDKSAYFAKRLHESMEGFGTNDSALIRIVATRCEIDMVDIKNSFMSMYGKSLEAEIAVRIIFHFLYLRLNKIQQYLVYFI